MKHRRLLGLFLRNDMGRAYHGRSLQIVRDEPLPLPPIKKDWRMTVAAVCVGVSVVGLILSAVLAIVWP